MPNGQSLMHLAARKIPLRPTAGPGCFRRRAAFNEILSTHAVICAFSSHFFPGAERDEKNSPGENGDGAESIRMNRSLISYIGSMRVFSCKQYWSAAGLFQSRNFIGPV
jgi:hypothetical protein